MSCGVYKIGFRNTDKVYIGSSKDIEKRLKQHKAMLQSDCHHSYKLQEYYNLHGEHVYCSLVEECDEYLRTIYEADYINKFNSIGNGFNVAQVRHAFNPDLHILSEVIHLPTVLPLHTKLLSSEYSVTIAVVASYMKFNYESCLTNGISYGESYDSISTRLNISVSAVRSAIRKLRSLGIIRVVKKEKGHFNMNYYEFSDGMEGTEGTA